jgi:hypothetical protein
MSGQDGAPKKRVNKWLASFLIAAPVGAIAWAATAINGANQQPQSSVTSDNESQTSLEVQPPQLPPELPQETGAIHEHQSSVHVETVQPSSDQPPQTTVEINGQSIDVPDQGNVHKVIQDANGTTTLDLSVDSNVSSGSSESSTNIELNTTSESTVEGD